MKNLDILYEDDSCIIVNKPAGLAVQGGSGVKSSLDKILSCMRSPAPLLVHRLDKDTSGVLLAAKNREAAFRFSRVIGAERKSVKKYIAVCSGRPPLNEGVIKDDLLIRNINKKAETKFKVIKTGNLTINEEQKPFCFSVLEIEPGTGRMHQIRRHLAMAGNPVLGDGKYGDFKLNKTLRREAGLKRLLLHASRLIIKECGIDISSPLPEAFSSFY